MFVRCRLGDGVGKALGDPGWWKYDSKNIITIDNITNSHISSYSYSNF